jgi:pyruvate kinase
MKNLKAQIIATIGPVSSNEEILKLMIESGLDVVRLNFSWGDLDLKKRTIELIKKLAKDYDRRIPIIADLPGPRIQEVSGHTFDHKATSSITEEDKSFIKFAVEHDIEYIAVSFVASAKDILECREIIKNFSGNQKIIAKIERKEALDNLAEIVKSTDAVMVARGDLGNEIALEKIPFIQKKIIKIAKVAGKPVIVATQMLFSMVEYLLPTRAEVSDVETAILEGADAVMLSEETARGNYPAEAVAEMVRIVLEAEKHMSEARHFNHL